LGKASTKVRFFEQNGKVKCYIEGAYCFTQGTPILLANDQLKPIEQIAVGDTVATYNHELKRRSFGVVKRLFKRSTKKLTRLAIAGSLLFATPSHKIYADGEYQPASSVTTDSELLAANGKKLQIQSAETIDSTASVYNFEVKGDHNYFAGANGVLVHNSCGWKTLRKRVVEAGKEARFRTFHQSIVSSGLTPVQRKKLYDKIEALGDKSSDFIDDFAENIDALKKFAGDDKLVESWKVLDDTGSSLKTNIDELTVVSKHLDDIDNFGGYDNWRLRTGRTRHSNWVQVDDITSKVLARKPHVLEIEGLDRVRNYRGNRLEGFTGCHSKQALDDFIGTNGGAYQIRNKPINLVDDQVFNGQPVILKNGKEYVKTNGRIVEYETGKFGGTSTFFPENWDNARVLEEVEHAIKNNHGVAPGNNPSEYFGFSKNGKVEIHFYLKTDGTIGSYFPKL